MQGAVFEFSRRHPVQLEEKKSLYTNQTLYFLLKGVHYVAQPVRRLPVLPVLPILPVLVLCSSSVLDRRSLALLLVFFPTTGVAGPRRVVTASGFGFQV